jgi:hypothetical protein
MTAALPVSYRTVRKQPVVKLLRKVCMDMSVNVQS